MKNSSAFMALTVLVIIGLFIFGLCTTNDEQTIRDWASSNGYTVSSIEHTWFDNGPFPWYSSTKGIRFYRVEVMDHDQQRVTYFRLGSIFGPEQRWDE